MHEARRDAEPRCRGLQSRQQRAGDLTASRSCGPTLFKSGQTNGMVERFNRRLGDHLGRMPHNRTARRFRDHAKRDAYLAQGLRMKDTGEDLLHVSVIPCGH